MNIFLCGNGRGAESVLAHLLTNQAHKVCVFSYEGTGLLEAAAQLGILRRTVSVNDLSAWPFQPSLIVSIGYLDIMTAEVLGKCDGINCHYALLPMHRGRSAVPWAIVDGDRVTGVSWHRMTERVDRGRLLMQASCIIDQDETQASLFDKLHDLAAATFPAVLRLAWAGWDGWAQQPAPTLQYHRAGPPFGGVIGEGWTLAQVDRMIRAMTYPPLPPATFRGQEVRTMGDFLDVLAGKGGQ